MIRRTSSAALVAALLTAAGSATAAAHHDALSRTPCPPPPARFRPAPFSSVNWNWEIGQWLAACAVGESFGATKLAALNRLSTGDPRAIAAQVAGTELTLDLRIRRSRTAVEQIGVARVKALITAGILMGFRLRGGS